MTGQPIFDGYGSPTAITDGFGADILDGYPASPVFAPGRLAHTIASHFSPPKFPGRKPRPVGVGRVPTPVSPPHPYAAVQHLQRAIASHFARSRFAGRRLPRRDFVYSGGSGLPARASQLVIEALLRDPAGARASQIVVEALLRDNSAVRASQLVVEAIYRQDDPTFVRASQIVLEVLVPYVELPVIPIYPQLASLTYEVVKRPKFSTGTGVSASGREIRVNYWSQPQWEWDLTYTALGDTGAIGLGPQTTASDIKTLIGFFLTCFGSFLPFYFTDPTDCQVTGQSLGTGDGFTTTFPLVRTYGLGAFTGTENVGSVNLDEAVNIYLNGVVQGSGVTISNATPCGNYIQFATPPAAGVEVTADFQFYFFCRLKDDSYDFSQFEELLWDTKKITIFSLKN